MKKIKKILLIYAIVQVTMFVVIFSICTLVSIFYSNIIVVIICLIFCILTIKLDLFLVKKFKDLKNIKVDKNNKSVQITNQPIKVSQVSNEQVEDEDNVYIINNNTVSKANGKPLTADDCIDIMRADYYNKVSHDISKNGGLCPYCGKPKPIYMPICEECYKSPYPLKNDFSDEFRQFLKENAKEMMLKQFLKVKKYTGELDYFPVYFKYAYYIKADDLFEEMYKNKLIRNANLKEFLESITVNELKEILTDNNIKCKRKKSELITQILENNVSSNKFKEISKYYVVSEEGKKFYEKHYEYVQVHKYIDQRSYEKFYELRKKYKIENGYSFADIYSMILGNNPDFRESEDLANLYYEEENYAKAIVYCIRVIIYHCCYSVCSSAFSNEEFYEYLSRETNQNLINDKTIDQLRQMEKFYDENILKEQYNHIKIKPKLCSIDTIEKFIEETLSETDTENKILQFPVKQEKIRNLNSLKDKIIKSNNKYDLEEFKIL